LDGIGAVLIDDDGDIQAAAACEKTRSEKAQNNQPKTKPRESIHLPNVAEIGAIVKGEKQMWFFWSVIFCRPA
jgi:predicted NodU family carbamoyl transferase